MMNKVNSIKIENSIAVLFIYILTFPVIDPDYSIGLDSSYVWALNHLFNVNYALLKEIVYPLGPLAFLKIPTTDTHNLEYFLLFYSLIKLWFISLFIYLSTKLKPDHKILNYIITTVILLLFNVDCLIIGISFIHTFLYLQNKKFLNIALGSSVAFVGVCIKSSIGISAFSALFVAFLIDWYHNREYKRSLKFAGVTLFTSLFWGLIVFNSFGTLVTYCVNVLKLSLSYSSALSIFPPNNWILLTLFLLSVALPPLIEKTKRVQIIFLLFLPVLFAMWKHAITRQDFSHSSILLSFLFLYWGTFVILSEIRQKQLLFLAVISISLFYSNMSNTWDYHPKTVEINGVNNFESMILELKSFKQKYIQLSNENVRASVLDSSTINIVRSSSIDSYPWELSYFSANNLNWKPRRTLQSGSFSRWLDGMNAQDFDRNNGPEYIILHYVSDSWNGNFGSIDGRYLLNDNPFTISNVFNYYNIKLKTSKYLLLEKNKTNNFAKIETEKKQTTQWNKWVDCETKNTEILRLKLSSKTSLLGKIKNFLYKSEIYYIDYMFGDGSVLTYRYIPENAKDGIWINPFIRFPDSDYQEIPVSKVRFRCSNSVFNKKDLEYQFERILIDTNKYSINESIGPANALFLKNKQVHELTIFETFDDFDNPLSNKTSGANASSEFFFSGKYSNLITPNGFSYSVKINLDSLWSRIDTTSTKVVIQSDLNYLNSNSDATHVISLTGSENDFWKGSKIERSEKKSEWNYSHLSSELDRKKHTKGILALYVWNNGKQKVFVDDMKVVIKAVYNH